MLNKIKKLFYKKGIIKIEKILKRDLKSQNKNKKEREEK